MFTRNICLLEKIERRCCIEPDSNMFYYTMYLIYSKLLMSCEGFTVVTDQCTSTPPVVFLNVNLINVNACV